MARCSQYARLWLSGGGGSAGVIFASAPLHAASQANPGTNGLTGSTNGLDSFGATPGTQFTPLWRTNVSPNELPLSSPCTLKALPVELTRFEAVAKGFDAHLSWRTASESQNARFDIERSIDGIRFTRIGSLAGAGTTTAPRQYTYLDADAGHLTRLLYYRLRQIDKDSSATLSPVRAVSFLASSLALLTPNPAHETVTIDLSQLPNTAYTIVITDMLGRRVLTQAVASNQRVPLAIGHLQPGAYVVAIQSSAGQLTHRLIKQ